MAARPLPIDALPAGALVSPTELAGRWPRTLASGLPALDGLLGGGFPEGRITELRGERGGRTTLAFRVAAGLSREGRLVAVVDGPDAFDARAAEAVGVDLRRLLWVRPPPPRAAGAADALVRSGLFALVLLDLPRAPLPAPADWVRLARLAETHRTALVTIGAPPGRGPGFCATVALSLRHARTHWLGRGPGRLLAGFSAQVELVHDKRGRPPGAVRLHFRAPEPFPEAPREDSPDVHGHGRKGPPERPWERADGRCGGGLGPGPLRGSEAGGLP